MKEYVVALDAMGGDNAPRAVVQGAFHALRTFEDLRILLVGPKDRLEEIVPAARDVCLSLIHI